MEGGDGVGPGRGRGCHFFMETRFAECLRLGTRQTCVSRELDLGQSANPSKFILINFKKIICRVFYFCRVSFFFLPSVLLLALGKLVVCRVLLFSRVFFLQRSAKSLFAECPKYSTQQTLMHSANKGFPVVTASRLLRHPVPELP